MNGIHDLGGMHGHGPIAPPASEPPFRYDWERRAFSLFPALFAGGHFNVDEFRHAIERMAPAEYLESSYYEHWLHAFETLLLEKGVVTPQELWGARWGEPVPNATVLTHDIVPVVLSTGASTRAADDIPGRFAVGDAVRTRNQHPTTHTRLPGYARGKVGMIELLHGTFSTPDSVAHGLGAQPQQLYTVRFTAAELWGHTTPDSVCIDLWDSYLEPAQ